MVALMFVQPLIVDKNMGPLAAIKTSIKIASSRWFRLFGLGFLIMFFNFIGILLFGIGLIWTLPLGLIAYGMAYRKLFGVAIKDKSKKNSQLLD